MKRMLIAGGVLALTMFASLAHADPTEQDRALADALYGDAGKLAQQGDFAGAKKKLEASLALDPGIGTLIRLSWCEEKLGNLASAWTRANEAEGLARRENDKRATEAAEMAKRLEPLLPKLALRLAPGNRGEGFEIRRDGVALKSGAWDAEIPVDPGEHVIEASAPGKKTWTSTVRIDRAATTTTVAIPVLDADTSAPVGGGGFWSSQRVAGVAVAGTGAAGLVVGSILGGLALSKASSLKSGGHCNADLTVCDAVGVPQWQDGQMLAHGSTAALVVGGIALAAGVVVFATAPRAKASGEPKSGFRVIVGPVANGASLRFSGGW